MKLKTKLILGFVLVLTLACDQVLVQWWRSHTSSRDMGQFEQIVLRQSVATDRMQEILVKVESEALAAMSPAGRPSADLLNVPQVDVLLQQFRTNLNKTIEVSKAGEAAINAEDDPSERILHREQATTLAEIETIFGQLESEWRLITSEHKLKTAMTPTAREQLFVRLLSDKMRPALTRFDQNLETATLHEVRQIFANTRHADRLMTATSAIVVLVMLAAAIFVGRLVLRPLDQFVAVAKEVTGGNRQRRLALDRKDEFGVMARTFNEMLDALQITTISRDELEKTVRLRTEELDRFFTASADVMCIGDFSGRLVRVNSAFASLFGYTEEEFVAIPPGDNIHPEDFPRMQSALGQLITGAAESVEFQVRGRARNGTWRTLSWKAVAAADLKLIYGTARDVTELYRATEALRESEENLATTLNSIGDGVLVADVNGLVTRLNPVAEQLTGWIWSQAVGRPVADVFNILHEETRQPAVLPIAEVIAQGKVLGLPHQTVLLSRTGVEHPIDDSCAPICDAQGRVIGAVLVFHDVAAERFAAQQLRDRETMLRTLSNNLPSGATYRLIGKGEQPLHFQYISDGIERLTGAAAAAILADPQELFGLIHPEDQPQMQEQGKAALVEFRQFDCQARIRTTSGEIKWTHWRSLPHALPNGEVAWDGLIVDITPLKLAEAELHQLNEDLESKVRQRTAALTESDRRHRALLGNLHGMAYRCRNDSSWTMEFMSDGCRDLLGIEPEDFTLGRITYDSVIHPEDRARVWDEVQSALAKSVPYKLEYRVKHASGEWRWVWEQGRLVPNEGQGKETLEGLITDITQRKLAEAALSQQEQRLSSIFPRPALRRGRSEKPPPDRGQRTGLHHVRLRAAGIVGATHPDSVCLGARF